MPNLFPCVGPKYTYSTDLQLLDSFSNPQPPTLPAILKNIATPLQAATWSVWLNYHPDPAFADYLLQGLTKGFRIGFDYTNHSCRAAKRNHPSALNCPEVISESIAKEVAAGRLIGPFTPACVPYAHISSLGAVPKKHSSNKWRLILDLSHPRHHSVNDGIRKDLCSLSYTSVDNVVRKILSMGRGTMLAKIDIEHAFRNIPVHPDDRHLLGMAWDGSIYIDTVLPFGLRSAPKIFNAVADGLQWIACGRGVSDLDHLLDDFITTGQPNSDECARNLDILVDTCRILGMPIAPSKTEGPATTLVFLGIEVDSISMQLRLPLSKLHRLQATTQEWAGRKTCTKHDLQSLIGQLHDASIIIRPGRTFIRRLLDLLKASHHRRQKDIIRLNTEARSDILWWSTFIADWNGLSMFRASDRLHPDQVLTSDASGSWGCGAFWSIYWFQLPWDPSTALHSITVKELIPIVFAVAIWGHAWTNNCVLCLCDNEAVVAILKTGTSNDKKCMSLLRCLHFFTAHFNIALLSSHIPGPTNTLADALSRNNIHLFFSTFPQASPTPTPIPLSLISMLLQLDLPTLERSGFMQASLAPSTQSSYATAHRRYTDFCKKALLQPYPTTESTLCSFVAYLGSTKIKHQTIKCYLSGIRFQHIIRNFTDPFIKDMSKLHYVLRGIKKTQCKEPLSHQKRLPITPHILHSVQRAFSLDSSHYNDVMLWAAALLCFFGFLRSGEITIPKASSYDPTAHLNLADLAFDHDSNPSVMRVTLKASKTDPFRLGVQIYVGRTSEILCPIKAMLAYLALRGSSPGILFHYADKFPLTKSRFITDFRAKLCQCGIDSRNYAGHSFRIGAASTAAAIGIADSTIQTLGRWKSDAYLLYVKLDPRDLATISTRLCSPVSNSSLNA